MDKSKDNLFKAIQKIIESMGMPYDQTKPGRVIEILSNHRYKVKIYDKIYTIKSLFHYNVDERVWVLFPCGNDKDLYIYPNKPSVTVSDTEPQSTAEGDVWITT